MSVLRPRAPRAAARKPPKAPRRPPPARRDWDSTVHDLTVHQATPEDILRRHEIHKSKNKVLVHLELQEKAPKRKIKKQRQGAPDSLEKRKLALMREILSDQYQLQDVLEQSDQAMAVVKDLFGDAPRRHTGFPNVTMAPDCDLEYSQSPIIQKRDPPTQLSILSESVMDSQALNEIEGESSSCHSGDSADEQNVFQNYKSSIDMDRLLCLLKKENSVGASQLWADEKVKTAAPSQETNVPVTPTTASLPLEDTALNATNVVRRIQSRLQNEDEHDEHTPDSPYIARQVLNPNSRKHKQVSGKVKRKQTTQIPSKQKRNDCLANSITLNLPSSNTSSLDILNHMIHEVENELEEYERCTGREVQKTQNCQGLTGFTLSLVNAVCRLMRYLKESEIQLRQEVVMKQKLEGVLNEHRELIDALTAEILLVREESIATQKQLRQYMVVTDEQLTSLTLAYKSLLLTDPKREQSPNSLGIAIKDPTNIQERSVLNSTLPKTYTCRDNMLKFPQEELSVQHPQWSCPPDTVGVGSSLPMHVFQPAVLLSPPRQKSSQDFSPLQNALNSTVQTHFTSQVSPSTQSTERRASGEKSSPSSVGTQSIDGENHLLIQRWQVPPTSKDSESSLQSHGQPASSIFSSLDQGQAPGVTGEGAKPNATEEFSQNKDLLGQIAELTRQNALIKAQLSKFKDCSQEAGDGLHQLGTVQNIHTALDPATQGQTFPGVSKNLEERIAELNRQSAEARGKLLQLIEQQKLASVSTVSPSISPIPPPPINWTGNAKRTIEVSVPVAEAFNSSKEGTPSPASGPSAQRHHIDPSPVLRDLARAPQVFEQLCQQLSYDTGQFFQQPWMEVIRAC
ncbi:spindle and centriole-associated protein 1 isoform X3 [Alligator mississippiensis]|uniref:spindle and centriole-associated protein 1 isoform X3 n=1 Tax=Alligator mississippiensis TaxID=8496 RepID=UPI002878076E|nr:spindle and centriole-associated protein 1 isoform X3 [Alligator mississippiensis]